MAKDYNFEKDQGYSKEQDELLRKAVATLMKSKSSFFLFVGGNPTGGHPTESMLIAGPYNLLHVLSALNMITREALYDHGFASKNTTRDRSITPPPIEEPLAPIESASLTEKVVDALLDSIKNKKIDD